MSYLHAGNAHRGKLDEAAEVLLTGLQAPSLRDRLTCSSKWNTTWACCTNGSKKHLEAAAAFGRAAAILDHPDRLLEDASDRKKSMRSAEIHERIGRNYLDVRDLTRPSPAFQDAQAKYPPGAGRLHFHLSQVYPARANSTKPCLAAKLLAHDAPGQPMPTS